MTLFEALVTLAIMVMLSALTFPAMDKSAQSLAAAEARVQLVSDMRFARGRAIAQDRVVALTPLGDGSAYLLDGKRRVLPGTVALGAGRDGGLAFYPDGSASGGPLRFRGGRIRAVIAADSATGAVRIGSGPADE